MIKYMIYMIKWVNTKSLVTEKLATIFLIQNFQPLEPGTLYQEHPLLAISANACRHSHA